MTKSEEELQIRCEYCDSYLNNTGELVHPHMGPNCSFIEGPGHKFVLNEYNIKQLLEAHTATVAAEAAREALNSLLDKSENTCICQLANTEVCYHNWSLCSVIRERLATLNNTQSEGKQDETIL